MNNLIVDIGMHKAEDTNYYLKKGFKVVAVDADPFLISNAQKNFSDYISKNQLILLNYAVSNVDNEEIDFHISQNTVWSSLKKEISNRQNLIKDTIKIKTRRLSSIFEEYGIPLYCKIDIEGYDVTALSTLKGITVLPQFISAESECYGDTETFTDEQALDSLNKLHEIGYSKFKLVDQSTLCVLKHNQRFYRLFNNKIKNQHFKKFIKYFNYRIRKHTNRLRLNLKFNYKFPFGSTGPFGNDLNGEWVDYKSAKDLLLYHRNSFYTENQTNWGFWCDWHATL